MYNVYQKICYTKGIEIENALPYFEYNDNDVAKQYLVASPPPEKLSTEHNDKNSTSVYCLLDVQFIRKCKKKITTRVKDLQSQIAYFDIIRHGCNFPEEELVICTC